jgi:tRNA modification GTPase
VNETIFALATAPGRAAIAVIRLSGPMTRQALNALAGRVGRPRQAALRRLTSPDGAPIDRALTLWLPGPASFTGEDSAELHLHGGPGVVDSATRALLALGLRLAEPGEFTRRAFENGRLDLDQAEAVADLVEAETSAQARQALGQLEGRLGDRHRAWRESLIEALAQLEAAVDFPDEEVPEGVALGARAGLQRLRGDLAEALADSKRGRRVREGYRIALIGAPNAGKSSLFNALLEREAAIVTPIPGTTRDVLEAALNLAGYRACLADMAGLRETGEVVEIEGVRRARVWAEAADLRLWLVDSHGGHGAWRAAADMLRVGDLCLLNKADLPPGADAAQARRWAEDAGAEVLSLALPGGAEAVRAWLSARVVRELGGSDFPAATCARHEALLEAAEGHLARALVSLHEPELAAEDVRLAGRALARIAGRLDAEDVLARVFATFCIGK